MLSRQSTKITLTPDDIASYEQRKLARDAMRIQQQLQDVESSQNSDRSTLDEGTSAQGNDSTPAAQTRAARSRVLREQRIGVGGSGAA